MVTNSINAAFVELLPNWISLGVPASCHSSLTTSLSTDELFMTKILQFTVFTEDIGKAFCSKCAAFTAVGVAVKTSATIIVIMIVITWIGMNSVKISFSFQPNINSIPSLYIEQMLQEWREDYTIILTSHFSRINTRLVSQNNAYITMFFIGFFEFSVYILMITAMSEIIVSPNMQFDTDSIDWNNDECNLYQKSDLQKCHKMSRHMLPLSATLMSLGTFFCCFLCKPPYGLIIGAVLR